MCVFVVEMEVTESQAYSTALLQWSFEMWMNGPKDRQERICIKITIHEFHFWSSTWQGFVNVIMSLQDYPVLRMDKKAKM